jgi:hypothetical protein
MVIECPLCKTFVDTVNLTAIPSSGGGRTCPNCKGAVRYSQPYRVLRVAASAVIAAGIVRVSGVRNLPTFCITTLVLWVPVSLFLNSYLIHYIPLFLVPWKPRTIPRRFSRPRMKGTRRSNFLTIRRNGRFWPLQRQMGNRDKNHMSANATLACDFNSCFQCQAGSSLVLRRPIETTRVTGHLKSDGHTRSGSSGNLEGRTLTT